MPLRPLPVIANTFRCTLNWVGPGSQIAANVFHVVDSTHTENQVAGLIDTNVTRAMWDSVVNAAQVNSVDVLKLDGVSGRFTLGVTGTKWQGAAGVTDSMPAVAFLIKFQTGLRGPAHRGRMYLPFTGESGAANGSYDATITGAIQTAWTAFLSAMSTAGAPLAVASYKHVSATLVSNAIAEQVLATQARRQQRLR